jgi:hypothetical protein
MKVGGAARIEFQNSATSGRGMTVIGRNDEGSQPMSVRVTDYRKAELAIH